jgi:hypothetical protein
VIATIVVRRASGLDAHRQHHEIGNPVYLQIGVVFAVLLAFVFNEVFGEYNSAHPLYLELAMGRLQQGFATGEMGLRGQFAQQQS